MARTQCPDAPPPSKDVVLPGEYDLDIPKTTYVNELQEMPVFQGSRTTMPWHMYTPEQAENTDQLFPLLVSLHGGYGREGADYHITQDGAPYMLASSTGLLLPENKAKYPTFIIFPHCLENVCPFYGNEWSSNGGAFFYMNDQPSANGSAMIELIEHVIEQYPVDPARVYITGVSMGGGGTWEVALRRPDLIAAAVPMAGHTPSLPQIEALAQSKVPVWAHISSTDYNNPGDDTKQAVNTISNAGGCAWFTEYQNVEHSHKLWQRSFLNPDLWPWLFAQSQPRAEQ